MVILWRSFETIRTGESRFKKGGLLQITFFEIHFYKLTWQKRPKSKHVIDFHQRRNNGSVSFPLFTSTWRPIGLFGGTIVCERLNNINTSSRPSGPFTRRIYLYIFSVLTALNFELKLWAQPDREEVGLVNSTIVWISISDTCTKQSIPCDFMRFSLMPFWDKVNSGFFHIHIYKFESKFMLDWMKWHHYSRSQKKNQ